MIEHAITHGLGAEKAKALVERTFAHYASRFERFEPRLSWTTPTTASFGFTAMGVALSGDLRVEAERFVVRLELPFLLRPFRDRAVERVEREVRALLARETPLEEPGGAADEATDGHRRR